MVAQLLVERVNLWVVDLVNELVVDADTGVEENRSIGMSYRVAVDPTDRVVGSLGMPVR